VIIYIYIPPNNLELTVCVRSTRPADVMPSSGRRVRSCRFSTVRDFHEPRNELYHIALKLHIALKKAKTVPLHATEALGGEEI
jgi:hypothetical protein